MLTIALGSLVASLIPVLSSTMLSNILAIGTFILMCKPASAPRPQIQIVVIHVHHYAPEPAQPQPTATQ